MAKFLPAYVSCPEQGCDWDTYEDTDDRCSVMLVLHMVVKHPDAYNDLTGNDPAVVEREYADWIRTFRNRL